MSKSLDEEGALYRRLFVAAYGVGPYTCGHCGEDVETLEVVHHIDHDHFNDVLENLQAMHRSCHGVHHRTSQALSEDTKRKISAAMIGRPYSAEHRETMREIRRSPEFREKIRQARTGTKASDETRRKMSEAHKGKRRTCPVCEKSVAPNWMYHHGCDVPR